MLEFGSGSCPPDTRYMFSRPGSMESHKDAMGLVDVLGGLLFDVTVAVTLDLVGKGTLNSDTL